MSQVVCMHLHDIESDVLISLKLWFAYALLLVFTSASCIHIPFLLFVYFLCMRFIFNPLCKFTEEVPTMLSARKLTSYKIWPSPPPPLPHAR